MEINITQGKVVLKKALAGARNKALMKAETVEGIKKTVLMVELLPHCIVSHPFGTTPIRQALDNLSIKDYDKLIGGLGTLMNPTESDVAKKSEELSKPKE